MKSFLIREALDLFQKYTVIEPDRFMASQKLIKYVYEEACGCLRAYAVTNYFIANVMQ